MDKVKQQTVQPAVNRVTHILRQRIAQGHYPPGQMMPTERELAVELAVSRTTVSRALTLLAGTGIVEQKVGCGTRVTSDALDRLPPGAVALVHAVNITPLHPEPALILQGAEDALTRLGCLYRPVPVAADDYTGPMGRAIRVAEVAALSSQFGAVLSIEIAGASTQLEALHRQGIPVVVANLEVDLDISATWVDHTKVAVATVKVLTALGHRRIGLIITSPERFFYGKTLYGYRQGLAQAGLAFDPSLVAYCAESTALDAYIAAKTYFASVIPLPTAIIAGRDIHAEGILRAAGELNLTVGRDFSLIGYDDTSWPQGADFLTTFREPCYEMGAMAAEMLVQRIYQGTAPAVEQHEIEAPLILRRSIGPVAAEPGQGSAYSVELHVR